MNRFPASLAAAAVSLLILSGCSEDEGAETGQAQPPAEEQTEPPADEEHSTEDLSETAQDTLARARELAEQAAKAAGEEASRIAQEAKEAADEALENAGPALERAGEVAGRFKESVDEIIGQARTDLDRAVKALEEQIAESDNPDAPATGDPAAVLSPADSLNADTRAAARARPAGVGPDYVGVWAADAANCAKIDQEAVEIFAVITPTTIRRYESVCNIEETPLEDGEATLEASCIAEGTTEEQRLSLSMPSEDALTIATGEGAEGVSLVRCHLPQ